MKRKTPTQRNLLLGLWMTLILVACNLGASSAPPTVAPRPTVTPEPTLGYAAPQAISAPGSTGATPIPQAEIDLYQLITQVDSQRLMLHVEAMQHFYTRHVNSTQVSETQGIGAAAQYIQRQFAQISAESGGRLFPYAHEFSMTYDNIPTVQVNVVGVLSGSETGAGTIVIGAHYDSVGEASLSDGTAYAPGANDNATGVAAVIELARIMSKREHRASIMFVAFSGEEVNRRGSRAMAQWVADQQIDVIAMINIDTIGNVHDRNGNVNDRQLRIYSQGPNDTSASRQLARAVHFIGFNQSLPLELMVQDKIDREDRYGDHFSFEEQGYPAIRFIQANEEKSNADPTDTIEYVEAYYLEDCVQTILAIATALADGPRPPANITLRDVGGGVQSLVWEPIAGASSYWIALRRPGSLTYDQFMEVTSMPLDWDGFTRYAGIAIAAKDENGLVGPLSNEYRTQ